MSIPREDFSALPLNPGPEAVDPLGLESLRRVLAAREPGSELLELADEDLLTRLGIIQPTNGRHITVAGLLLVGREDALRAELPGHEVIYLQMTNDTEYERRLDTRRALLALIEQLDQAIEPHNKVFTLKSGLFHFEIPDFPREVYREALLNALVHRDYSRNASVYLRHYPDRLQLSSPGGLYGGVTLDNILGHEPVTRNRLLAEILQRIRLVERAGMGVRRMYHIMLAFGKEPPAWEADDDYVRVSLRSGRTATGPGVDETFARFVADEGRAGRPLTLQDLLVLNWLKRNREIALSDVERLLQRGEAEAREAVNAMALRGLIEPFGQKGGRVHRLSNRVYSRLSTCVSYTLFRRAEAAFAENTIMNYLEEMPKDRRYVSNEIVRTLLRVSPDQAHYLLSRLVKKKLLQMRGRGRATRYYKTGQLNVFD
ncbi:MAG: ATP-binding protein [bacterium]